MTIERLAGRAEHLRVTAFPEGQRLWRVAWFGPIRFADRTLKMNQPSVLVHLAEVSDPAVRDNPDAPIPPSAAAARQIKRWVSVGTTVLLRIGDLWEGQCFFHRPALEEECFEGIEVDEPAAVIVKAGSSLAEGGFLIPFAEHPWHSENTHSYCLRITLRDGRYLVIPAMELIRFYYGSSADLLASLFTPPLRKNALYERASVSQVTRVMTLDLAADMPRASAEDIARLAGDPQAWSAAQQVGASCLKASGQRKDIYPIARFPFTGRTDLKVHGQWLSRGHEGKATFVVHRIASCSHAFPFQKLTFKLKGQKARRRRAPDQPLSAVSSEPRHKAARSAIPQQPRLEERDASTGLKPHTYGFRGDRVFPDLARKLIRGVKAVESGEPVQAGSVAAPVEDLAIGATGTSARRREALLAQIAQDQRSAVPEFLKHVIDALSQLSGFEIHLLTIGPEDGCTVPMTLLLDEDGVIEDALLIEEAGHSRPRRMAAFLVSRGEDRLTLIFPESDPVHPLAYTCERGDEDEVNLTMYWGAKDFLRDVQEQCGSDITMLRGKGSATDELLLWIRARLISCVIFPSSLTDRKDD